MAILFSLFGGLMVLLLGAEAFVRGAAGLARFLGIPPLVIGLTVVAFGTSAPELAVNLQAGLSGRADLALGNVVGSNIMNTLLILGISAAIAPLLVSRQLVRLEVPIMIGASLLLLLLGMDGNLNRLEGGLLVLLGAGYVIFQVIQVRRSPAGPAENQRNAPAGRSAVLWLLPVLLIGAGAFLLVWGSDLLVRGAMTVARAFGVSELVIGLTVVAIGTSLPELATSVVASLRGERDMAVGNVVGSNIFNILWVLGLTTVLLPEGLQVPQPAIHFDLPVMLAAAIACLPVFFTGFCLARWEGLLFIAYYLAYALYLILAASHHAALPLFNFAMLAFIIPLTVLTLLVLTWRALRAGVGNHHHP